MHGIGLKEVCSTGPLATPRGLRKGVTLEWEGKLSPCNRHAGLVAFRGKLFDEVEKPLDFSSFQMRFTKIMDPQ